MTAHPERSHAGSAHERVDKEEPDVPAWTTFPARRGRDRRRRLYDRRGGATAPRPSTAAPTAAPTTAASPRVGGRRARVRSRGASPIAGGLLDKVLKAGKLVVSTDPNYAPQSRSEAGRHVRGLRHRRRHRDRQAARRRRSSGRRPDWDVITAGGWGGRWDASVGSMTITTDRQKVLDFSDPYYYTPAQMAASTASGITTLDGLAGKTVCVGEATTYLDWLQGKKLDFGTLSPTTTPPAGVKADDPEDRRRVPAAVGRRPQRLRGLAELEHDGRRRDQGGLPLVKVGDPVYFEPLAVAVDKSGPDPTRLRRRGHHDRQGHARRRHADGACPRSGSGRPDRGAHAVGFAPTLSLDGGVDRRPHRSFREG